MTRAPCFAMATAFGPPPQPSSRTRLFSRLPSSLRSVSVGMSGPYCTMSVDRSTQAGQAVNDRALSTAGSMRPSGEPTCSAEGSSLTAPVPPVSALDEGLERVAGLFVVHLHRRRLHEVLA